ncbi:MAG: hypothetical protein H6565_15890 [Lewinellaceae bacterium]|nr:hypothetical protein [Lewinellaceae bacterium]MCB9353599.1 hypothetical protein [Lewinellaceae bacterium]
MVVRKDIDNTSAVLTVTVTRDEIKPKIDSELKKFRSRAAIKGFRQGQAPMDFVRKLYGNAIFSDTLNDLLANRLYEYLRESKLDVLGQPLPTENQRSFSFKISDPDPEYSIDYEVGFVAPFEMQGLDKKEKFERLTIANLDELAEEDLNYARKRMGKRSNPETDIQENDIVRIEAKELEGNADSAVKEGGWATTITAFIKDVPDEALKMQLLGLKKDDTLRFNARLLETQDKEGMYRKYILNLEDNDDREVGDWFEGTIAEVSRIEEADLNDDFYTGYFGEDRVSNRDEAIDEIKKGILRFYDVRSNALLMRSFQERLLSLNQIELPEKFLKRWLKVSNEGQLDDEQIEREYPAFAENLRWSLLRDKISERFSLEVTEEEIRAAYADKVRNYFQSNLPEQLIESSVERLMQNEKDVESTRRDLETDKIFEAIRGEVSINDKAIPSDEFHQIIDSISKKAEEEQQADAALREAASE